MKKIILTLCAVVSMFTVWATPYDLLTTLGSDKKSFSKIPPTGKPPVIEYTKGFYIRPALHDWTPYNALTIELKNQSSKPAVAYFRIISQPKEAKKGVWGYDWQVTLKPGKDFQKFTIPLKQLNFCRKPVGWHQIDRIDFCIVNNEQTEDYKVSIRNFLLLQLTEAEIKVEQPHRLGITKEEVAAMMSALPDKCTYPVPNYKNREFWSKYPISDFVKENALKRLQNSNIKMMNPQMWVDARSDKYSQGARKLWTNNMKDLGRIVSACSIMECVENKGRFIPLISEALKRMMNSPWTYPDSDPGNKVISEGHRNISLTTIITASDVLAAYWLLDDKLSPELRKQIRDYIIDWVVKPMRIALALPPGVSTGKMNYGHWCMGWIDGTNNITPFTYARVALVYSALVSDKKERAELFCCANKAIKKHVDNYYTPEGYSVEGISYWGMGFGSVIEYYTYLRDLTGGKVNLSKDPKLAAICQHARDMTMDPATGLYPSFSDGASNQSGKGKLFPWTTYNKFNVFSGVDYYAEEMVHASKTTMSGVSLYGDLKQTIEYMQRPAKLKKAPPRKIFYYVPSKGVMVSRDLPKVKETVCLATSGGSNFQAHNHCDLGSFVISVGDCFYVGDPGCPIYESKTRQLVNSSLMHPVPLVNEKQQPFHRESVSSVKSFINTQDQITLVYDLKKAYLDAGIVRLDRSFTHLRKTQTVILEDDYKLDKPGTFLGCLTSYFKPEQISKTTWKFGKLQAVFDRTDLNFTVDQPDVKMICQQKFYRLRYEVPGKQISGKIKITFSPVKK